MLFVLLVFILWPLAEIFVAILVAQAIGLLEMFALVAISSIAGIFVLRQQSRQAWIRFNLAMEDRRLPSREVGDGLMGLAAGVMLLIPGLISGVIGLLLLLPPTRVAARWLFALLVARRYGLAGTAATWSYTTYNSARGRGSRADYDVAGTAEEIPGDPANSPDKPDRDPPQLPPA